MLSPTHTGLEGYPQEVMRAWVQEWAKERVTIDWEKLLLPKGSKVLPRRWIVERTFFSWLGQNRRLSKDYERLCETSEAFIPVQFYRTHALFAPGL
jgi:transposase